MFMMFLLFIAAGHAPDDGRNGDDGGAGGSDDLPMPSAGVPPGGEYLKSPQYLKLVS